MDALDKAISNLDETFAQYVFGGIMAAIKKLKAKKKVISTTKLYYPVKVGKPTNKVPTVTVFGIEFEQGDGEAGVVTASTNYYGNAGRKWNVLKFEGEYIMWSRHVERDGFIDMIHVPENMFVQNFTWDEIGG